LASRERRAVENPQGRTLISPGRRNRTAVKS
jgi:hypothetical protein